MSRYIHSGFAHKRGSKVKNWKRRFFALKADGDLSYYAQEAEAYLNSSKAKGCFSIIGCTFVEDKDCQTVWPDDKRPETGFGIRVGERAFYVYCQTPRETQQWKSFIKKFEHGVPDIVESPVSESSEARERLTTVALKKYKHADLVQAVKYLSLRTEDLVSEKNTLELQLMQQDMSNELLMSRAAYLEGMLKKSGIDFVSSKQWASASQAYTAAASNASAPQDVLDEYHRVRAAIVIQRWFRAALIRKKFDNMRRATLARAQTKRRQSKNAVPVQRRAMSSARPGRLPSTSLGLRRATQTLAVSSSAQPRLSVSQKPLPSISHFLSTREDTRSASFTRYGFDSDDEGAEAESAEVHQSVTVKILQQHQLGEHVSVRVSSISSSVAPREAESSDIMAALQKEDQLDLRRARCAIYRFNKNPKKGIHAVFQAKLASADDLIGLVSFLCEERGVSRMALGDFLSLPEPLSLHALSSYASTFDFADAAIDTALRLFLLPFHIPGEAQKIDRVLTTFAKQYYSHNSDLFEGEDTAVILSFSILMLQTDLHNPNNVRKMTCPQFVRNNRGIDEGHDVNEAILTGIYRRISEEPFQCVVDHTNRVEDLERRTSGRWSSPLVTPERQFIAETVVNELSKSKAAESVKRVVNLWLFNDLLVVVSRSRWDRRYSLRQEISLKDCCVVRGSKPDVFFLRSLKQNTVLFKFAVLNDGSFVNDLAEYIEQVKMLQEPLVVPTTAPVATVQATEASDSTC